MKGQLGGVKGGGLFHGNHDLSRIRQGIRSEGCEREKEGESEFHEWESDATHKV
jgi:hypothetical protein